MQLHEFKICYLYNYKKRHKNAKVKPEFFLKNAFLKNDIGNPKIYDYRVYHFYYTHTSKHFFYLLP